MVCLVTPAAAARAMAEKPRLRRTAPRLVSIGPVWRLASFSCILLCSFYPPPGIAKYRCQSIQSRPRIEAPVSSIRYTDILTRHADVSGGRFASLVSCAFRPLFRAGRQGGTIRNRSGPLRAWGFEGEDHGPG